VKNQSLKELLAERRNFLFLIAWSIILSVFIFFMVATKANLFAQEVNLPKLTSQQVQQVNKVLKKKGTSVQQLERNGFKIFMGEFSGAGARITLDRVDSYLTNNDVIDLSQIRTIIPMAQSEQTLGKLKKLILMQNKEVSAREISGVILNYSSL